MIAAMDDGLGRIRAKLRAMGVENNTLIFFISDNGAPLKPGAWDGSLNLPLIGEKGMLTDGGVRTPFVAAWPGTLPAGKVYDWPVINLDVAATAVALAGLPHDDKLDGVNLMPFLTGDNPAAPHDYLYLALALAGLGVGISVEAHPPGQERELSLQCHQTGRGVEKPHCGSSRDRRPAGCQVESLVRLVEAARPGRSRQSPRTISFMPPMWTRP